MPVTNKPFSQACENNKAPILDVLSHAFAPCRHVLEIGSGTGQHAVYFAAALPHLIWQTSDLPQHHAGIRHWLDEARIDNLRAPLALDVTQREWPQGFDGVFTANTAHIMPWPAVVEMIGHVGALLPDDGVFCQYGPFKYRGDYTSQSNARFDLWLREIEPSQGIRDFEAIAALAQEAGLELENDHRMPANNQLLVWKKRA